MDRRRDCRIAVELPGALLFKGCDEQCIRYSQVSVNGCRIAGEIDGLLVGDVVDVRLGPVGVSRATVRWVSSAALGVEFHETLHPAIVEYFGAFQVTDA